MYQFDATNVALLFTYQRSYCLSRGFIKTTHSVAQHCHPSTLCNHVFMYGLRDGLYPRYSYWCMYDAQLYNTARYWR